MQFLKIPTSWPILHSFNLGGKKKFNLNCEICGPWVRWRIWLHLSNFLDSRCEQGALGAYWNHKIHDPRLKGSGVAVHWRIDSVHILLKSKYLAELSSMVCMSLVNQVWSSFTLIGIFFTFTLLVNKFLEGKLGKSLKFLLDKKSV